MLSRWHPKKVKRRRPQRPPTDLLSNGHRAVALEDAWGAGDPHTASSALDWRFLLAAGLIVAAALLLRLYHLGTQELWLDEAFSWHVVSTPKLLRTLLTENTPPLYYLLLRAWVRVAGGSEAALRLLSAVAGTLFVAVVLWAGRELFDTRVALWSGGVAALAPLHIYYSQEARAYVWLVLFLLLTHVLVWRALRENTWLCWALVSASALFALYTHYFAILGLFPGALLVWLWPGRERWRHYAAAMLASALGLLPWVVWSIGLTPHSYNAANWIRQVWENTPPAMAIPRSLEAFALGGQAGLLPIFLKQFTTLEFPPALRLLGLLVLGLLGLWVMLPWGDPRVGVPDLWKRKAWLALLLFLPLGALWLISLYRPIYAPGRYDLVAFPAYPLLLGLALRKAQRVKRVGPVVAPIVALLLLLPVGMKLVLYYQAPPIGTARATAKILDAEVPNGDVVVFTGLRGLPTLYYLEQSGYRWEGGECRAETTGRRFGCRMYPRETETTPADFTPGRVQQSPAAVRDDLEDFLRPLRATGGDLWVAFDRAGVSQQTIHLIGTDSLLFQEFRRLDLTFMRIQGAPALFRFRQTPDK